MATATLHISSDDLEFSGSYDATGDVVYLSAASDDKRAAAQETPEGNAVRLDAEGRVTHITAVNAKWLLERDGSVTATLRDGRRLRLEATDLHALLV